MLDPEKKNKKKSAGGKMREREKEKIRR